MIDPMQAVEMLASTATAAAQAEATHPHNKPPTIITPGSRVEHVNHSGKTMLWIVFVVMVIASAGGSALSYRVPLKKRMFHVITTLIVMTAAISYWAMATEHAVSWQHDTAAAGHHHHHERDVYRQVFWARYVDWAITTPLLLLDLGLLAGMAGGHIFITIVADLIMVLTGLFAAIANNDTQKWGWYTIACIAFLVIIWQLAVNARASAMGSRSDKAKKLYGLLALYTVLLWTAYPIIWAVGEGTGIISVDGEIIAYGILDLLAKPVFGAWLLFSHDVISDGNLDVGGFWSAGIGGEGRLRLGDDDGA